MEKIGAQSVMIPGILWMPLLFADSLGTLLQVLLYLYKYMSCISFTYHYTGAQALLFAAYGQGTGPILLDDVACTGTETRLIECQASPITTHNCVHFEDASVRCQAPPSKYPCDGM